MPDLMDQYARIRITEMYEHAERGRLLKEVRREGSGSDRQPHADSGRLWLHRLEQAFSRALHRPAPVPRQGH